MGQLVLRRRVRTRAPVHSRSTGRARSTSRAPGTTRLNLHTSDEPEALLEQFRRDKVKFASFAPPCGTFSRPREIVKGRNRKGPRPLQGGGHLLGQPSKNAGNLALLQRDNDSAQFSVGAYEWCLNRDAQFAVEKPRSSWMEELSAVKAMADSRGVQTVLHQCMSGGERDQWTKLLTNCEASQTLSRVCVGNHKHVEWAAAQAHRRAEGYVHIIPLHTLSGLLVSPLSSELQPQSSAKHTK